jgi:thiamine-phosphate pyrophosphorylase
MLVGCSTNNPDEARRAEANGADYVSVGRLFRTGSKQNTRPATLETLRAVRGAVNIPVCAIGGIDESNIDDVIAAGADMVSVIAAVVAAEDVREAACRLASRFDS